MTKFTKGAHAQLTFGARALFKAIAFSHPAASRRRQGYVDHANLFNSFPRGFQNSFGDDCRSGISRGPFRQRRYGRSCGTPTP